MNKNLVYLFIFSMLCINCTSVKKYNDQITNPISVDKLQEDINYTQKKLYTYYPNLYGYISKEQLDYKFDSLRTIIKQPITSNEFYFLISHVIASVRQGHMTMSPAVLKLTAKENRRIKKQGISALSQFSYTWENNKLYITKNKSNIKTIKIGTEIVAINNLTPQTIHKKYSKTFTSDGFNTTFLAKFFAKRFPSYITNEIGIKDSLTFVFKQKDSIYTQLIKRYNTEKKVGVIKKDSVKSLIKPIVNKAKVKFDKKQKRILGYDKKEKLYAKSLQFIGKDSTVALLKIRNFTQGRYDEAYAQIFDSIKKKKSSCLIIDLRDNPGGRISDITNLYSYLTDSEYTLIEPAKVVSKTSLWKLGIFNNVPKITYPLVVPFYSVYMGFTYFKTKKLKDGTYQYKIIGSKPEKNAANNFKGKMYILINGGSFSASCILASALKTNKYITFVGEETGGAFNGTVAGIMPVVTLPNSKIKLRLGLMDIKTKNQTNQIGRGIFPDIEIIQTIEDKSKNYDPELNWILEDITKNTQPNK